MRSTLLAACLVACGIATCIPPTAADAAPVPNTVTMPFVLESTTLPGMYIGYYGAGPDEQMRATRPSSYADAAAQASRATFPGPGTSGHITIAGDCVYSLLSTASSVGIAPCNEFASTYDVGVDGSLFDNPTGYLSGIDFFNGQWRPTYTKGYAWVLSGPEFVRDEPLTGRITSIDAAALSAQLTGTATANADIRANGRSIATVGTDKTWSGSVSDLKNGDNSVVVSQWIGTRFVDQITLNVHIDSTARVTADVRFDPDVSKEAVISGTGEDGAVVVVTEGGSPVGLPSTVVGGKWSVALPASLGMGDHLLTATQDIDGSTATVTAEYGEPVAITRPAVGSIVPGLTEISGTGANGAEITIAAGGATQSTTVVNGTWGLEIELPASVEAVDLVATQHARGNVVTTETTTVTPDGPQTLIPLVVETPLGGFYRPLTDTIVSGKATPYAQIQVTNQWNLPVGTTSADAKGHWEFSRQFGPSAAYILEFTQTLFDGRTQSLTNWHLDPVGAFRALVVTSPSGGDTYENDVPVTFEGTATPGATIVVTTELGGTLFSTRASQVTGEWSASRQLGPDRSYSLTITQTAPDQTTDRVTGLILTPAVAARPFDLTSDVENDTYRPGSHTFAGTGTSGAVVSAVNQWGTSMGSTRVGATGTWAFDRNLGPTADYDITFAMAGEPDRLRLRLNAPKWTPLTQTNDVTIGYVPGRPFEFTGRATPFATIRLVNQTDDSTLLTADADKNGRWTMRRSFGPTHVYQLALEQTALDGTTDGIPPFSLSPTSVG